MEVLRAFAWGTALCLLLVLPGVNAGFAQTELSSDVPTNLDVMRTLNSEIARSVIGALAIRDTSRVNLTVSPEQSAWLIEGRWNEQLNQYSARRVSSGESDYAIEIGVAKLQVAYTGIRRDGFFGERVVDRTVSVELDVKATDMRHGAVLFVQPERRDTTDTVPLSLVEHLETPGVNETKGVLPSGRFFDNLAEPVVTIGAIGVAVFLLFHVRS